MQCVLVGNYGVGNIGDEALKEYFLSVFPDVDWRIVRGHPVAKNEVHRLPLGIRSFFTSWWRTVRAIAKSDAMVFGGGSLFTDIESGKACVIWWSYAAVARLVGTPYFLASQGVGPFLKSRWENLARKVFERAAFVSVRDAASLKRVQAWKLRKPAVLTFDAAFARFCQQQKLSPEKKTLLIIPRTNSDARFIDIAKAKAVGEWDAVRILLMQPDADEKLMAKKLQESLSVSSEVIDILSVEQLLSEIASASEVVAQRFHGALAAFAVGVLATVSPQKEGDKMAELAALMAKGQEGKEGLLRLLGAGESALREALAVTTSKKP